MHGRTNDLEGEFTEFDPADPAPFLAAAGTRVTAVNEDGTVTIRSSDPEGTPETVHPGWLVFRPDGSGPGGGIFTSPDNVSDGTGTLFRALP